jgi:hypothetical protein
LKTLALYSFFKYFAVQQFTILLDIAILYSGTLEMWIEMMTPQKAAEIPRIVLKETTPSDVELRYTFLILSKLKIKC